MSKGKDFPQPFVSFPLIPSMQRLANISFEPYASFALCFYNHILYDCVRETKSTIIIIFFI